MMMFNYNFWKRRNTPISLRPTQISTKHTNIAIQDALTRVFLNAACRCNSACRTEALLRKYSCLAFPDLLPVYPADVPNAIARLPEMRFDAFHGTVETEQVRQLKRFTVYWRAATFAFHAVGRYFEIVRVFVGLRCA